MINNTKAWWLASLMGLSGCLPSGEEMGGASADDELGAVSQELSEDAVRTRVVGSNTEVSSTRPKDRFGTSLALSDDGLTMVVGAPNECSRSATQPRDNSLRDSGAVYVFTRQSRGAKWIEQAYLKAFTPDEAANFGDSVAISGDGKYVAVGAPHESETNAFLGAVYVFRHEVGGGWVQDARVQGSLPSTGDWFGKSVTLSTDGSTLAVGAENLKDGEQFSAGAAYVFRRGPSGWSEQALLRASNAGEWDSFGAKVALDGSGNLLAISAPQEASVGVGVDGNADEDIDYLEAGAVYVFSFEPAEDGSGSVWRQRSYIKASNTETKEGRLGNGDTFGSSLALSSDGSTLAVGAPEEDSAARMINGNQTSNAAVDAGAAYVFRATADGSWTQEAYVKPNNTDAGDLFGTAVALTNDGNYLVVGADYEGSDASQAVGANPFSNGDPGRGAAYVFARTGTEWAQQAYLKPARSKVRAEGPPDGFGRSVAVDGAGDAIAIGTMQYSDSEEGVFTFTDP